MHTTADQSPLSGTQFRHIPVIQSKLIRALPSGMDGPLQECGQTACLYVARDKSRL